MIRLRKYGGISAKYPLEEIYDWLSKIIWDCTEVIAANDKQGASSFYKNDKSFALIKDNNHIECVTPSGKKIFAINNCEVLETIKLGETYNIVISNNERGLYRIVFDINYKDKILNALPKEE